MRTLPLLAAASALALAGPARAAPAPAFERDVLPVLTKHCLTCHGGLHQRNDLDLRTLATTLKGGKAGPAVVPGKPDDSPLWKMVSADVMPKGPAKLAADEKKAIREWIAGGAKSSRPDRLPDLPATPRPPAEVAAAVDKVIDARLAAAGLTPAPPADDAEFLRRAYLDLTGRVPPADKAAAFLDSKDPAKRAKLVDELLADPAYGRHFGTVWHNLTVPLADGKRAYNDPYLAWLADGFNGGRGWDKTVREVLSAAGDAKAVPQVAMLAGYPEPNEAADLVGRLFLGVRLECAECHDSVTSPWRQKEDYWGTVAFFARVKVDVPKKGKGPPVVSDGGGHAFVKGVDGAAVRVHDLAARAVGQVIPARFPGAEAPPDLGSAAPRAAFAAWLTARDNPFFAPAAANRWWHHLFARGLVDPVDDAHAGNPPSHPEALHQLAHELRVSGFDLKHLIRCICLTSAYGRTSRGPAGPDPVRELFGRMAVKVMTPETLHAALTQVYTGGSKQAVPFALHPPGAARKGGPKAGGDRAAFVNLFNPSDEPPDPAAYTHGVLQNLLLVNEPSLNDASAALLTQLLKAKGPTTASAVEALYLTALARRPTAAERERLVVYVEKHPDRRKALGDVLWLLLNGAEFVCVR